MIADQSNDANLEHELQERLPGRPVDVVRSYDDAFEALVGEIYDCAVLYAPSSEQLRHVNTVLQDSPIVVVAPLDQVQATARDLPEVDIDTVVAEPEAADVDELALRIRAAVNRGMRSRKLVERFESMAQSLSAIAYSLDCDGRFTHLNRSVTLLGYDPEELIGRHFSVLLDPEVVPQVSREQMLEHYRGRATGALGAPKLFDERRRGRRKTTGLQVRLRPKDAEPDSWMLGSVTAYGEIERLPDGSIESAGTVGLIHDITLRRKSEETLRKLYAAVEGASTGCVIIDEGLCTEYVNPSFYHLSGYGPDELLGTTIDRLAAIALDDAVRGGIEQVRTTGDAWSGQISARSKSGTRHALDAQIRPVRDETGELTAYVVLIDRPAVQTQSAGGDRVCAPRDVRTPLWSIVGLADLTLATTLAAEQRVNLEMIRYSARSVLDLFADDSGETPDGTVAVVDLLHAAVRPFEFDVRERYSTVAIRSDVDTSLTIAANINGLSQLLKQMLAHAAEQVSHATITVSASVQQAPGGAAKSHRLLVGVEFPRLGQGAMPTHMEVAARRLDGDVSRTEQNGRTCLTLTVPVAVIRVGRTTDQADLSAQIRDLRILLAEDNLINQRVAAQMLRKLGSQVVTANNGREAVESARRAEFDVVLMDISMPETDGIEATAQIRGGNGFATRSDVPIVALTAYALPEDRIRFLSSGLDECVVKPVDWDRLFRVILELLHVGRSRPTWNAHREEQAMDDAYNISSFVTAYEGSPEVMNEILAIFTEETPEKLERLQAALDANDFHTVDRTAHSLANTAGTLRAKEAVDVARETEAAARREDAEGARSAATRLIGLVQEMLRQIAELDQ